MRNKGFTLIELLAVIVILAIIAIIAIPVITNIISKTKDGSAEASIKNYIGAVEKQIAINLLDSNSKDIVDGKYSVSNLKDNYNLKIKGKGPDSGWVEIEKDEVIGCNLNIENFNFKCNNDDLAMVEISSEDRMMDSKAQFNLSELELIKTMLGIYPDSELTEEVEIFEEIFYTKLVEQFLYFLPITVDTTNIEELDDETLETVENFIIEKIITVDSKNVPNNAILSKDVSARQNGSVMLWCMDEDNDSKYEIYIGQDGGVVAPENSQFLFGGLLWMNMSNNSDKEESEKNVIDINLDNFYTKYTKTMDYMFVYYNGSDLNLKNFDTTNVKSMASMFAGCWNLTSLDLSSFNTVNVTDMSGMFGGCEKLTSLDLSSFNTANVTDMASMFAGCKNLTSLDLSSFNTANVTNMSGMFMDDESLKNLNISNFNNSKVTNYTKMFHGCNNLISIKIGKFTFKNPINRVVK